jgi:signal transduction histidine kinase
MLTDFCCSCGFHCCPKKQLFVWLNQNKIVICYMRKYFYIFFFLLLISSILFPKERYIWQKLPIELNRSLRFVHVNSEKDFSVIDKSGNIFVIADDKYVKIKSPATGKSSLISALFQNRNKIYLTHTTPDWISHLNIWNGQEWKEIFTTKKPIYQIISSTKGEIFIAGNFGLFSEIVDGRVREFTVPFKSHIHRVYEDEENSFLIFTKSNGIWQFDCSDKKFSHISKSNLLNKGKDFRTGKLILGDFNNHYFWAQNGELKETGIEDKLIYSVDYDKLGKRIFSFYDVSFNRHKVEFPSELNFVNFRVLNGNQFLALTDKGEIFLGKVTDKFFFKNESDIYNINGSKKKLTMKSVAADINGDGLLDILEYVFFNDYGFEIHLKKKNAEFTNLANDIGEKINLNHLLDFRVFDYNSDGKEDIVTLSLSGEDVIFTFFKNRKNSKFVLDNRLVFPLINNTTIRKTFLPFDYDKDEDIDILLTEYYGKGDSTGKLTILENSFYGNHWDFVADLATVSRSWNKQTIAADFNNDGFNDLFIATKWRKNILLINHNGAFVDETETRFVNLSTSETRTAGAFDFDNDGDLDLLLSTDQKVLCLFENNGEGVFHDVSGKYGIEDLEISSGIVDDSRFSFGDINNDGFTDFILRLSGGTKSFNVILNNGGKNFRDVSDEININFRNGKTQILADFDNDGDLDFFVGKNGADELWVNNTNNDNFIKLKLNGIKSNKNGIGAKISVYDKKNKLVGFKQIGSNEFSNESQNNEIHFGVPPGMYDLVVDFYGGHSTRVRNILNGSTVTVNEEAGFGDILGLLPARIFSIAGDKEFLCYSCSFLIGILLLLVTISIGQKKFRWEHKIVSMVFILNSSIFWLTIIFTLDSENMLVKYSAIPLLAFASSAFTLAFTFILTKINKSKISDVEAEDELMQLMITFSHGEWALRNLNSLQLFFLNFSDGETYPPKFLEQIENRITTFRELTKFNIERIIQLARLSTFHKSKIDELANNFSTLSRSINQIDKSGFRDGSSAESIKKGGIAISQIKELLTELKHELYRHSSSNPKIVIETILKQYVNESKYSEYKFNFENNLHTEKFVLIKEFELADILVNLIDNSISAMKKSAQKELTIKLGILEPKITIDVSDTGEGIEGESWEEIFERTYSSKKSGGEGLWISRKLLKKYGGRIFVKSSNKEIGTTIRIELIEGRNK